MRRFLADTAALIVFSTVAAGLIEWFLVGLAPSQILQTRLATVPVILVTARPYGIYRDWVFHLAPVWANRRSGAAWLDIIAFVTFQAPVYAAILVFAGATGPQIFTAVTTAMVGMVIAGRPYGIFLLFVRRLFGVQSAAGSD